jgi:hypothetical protein
VSKYLRLGVIGGCLGGFGKHVKFSQVYHRILTKRIKKEIDVSIRVVPTYINNTREVLGEVERLIREKEVDGIIVQIRPNIFYRKCLLLWKYHNKENRKTFTLNPALFQRARFDWPEYLDQRRGQRNKSASGRSGANPAPDQDSQSAGLLSLTNINCSLAVAVGLHNWAIEVEIRNIEDVKELCDRYGIPVFILGPLSRPFLPMGNWLVKNFSQRMAKELPEKGITYIEVTGSASSQGEPLFHSDNVHVNPAGHERVADSLYGNILNWAITSSKVK